MLAYNRSIPDPTLLVRQGSESIVNVTNDGDVDATVHWHGLRLENRLDGVPHDTQKPIPLESPRAPIAMATKPNAPRARPEYSPALSAQIERSAFSPIAFIGWVIILLVVLSGLSAELMSRETRSARGSSRLKGVARSSLCPSPGAPPPPLPRRATVAIGRWAAAAWKRRTPSDPRTLRHSGPRYPPGAKLVASITALMSPWARQVGS